MRQKLLFEEKVENEGDNDTEKNWGDEREIESKIAPLDKYVSGKAEQAYLWQKSHDKSDDNDNNADK